MGDEQVTWGIFNGFGPRDTVLGWTPPTCPGCEDGTELLPWIDWCSYASTVGYCPTCANFFTVRSVWELVPDVHARAELEQLARFSIGDVAFDRLPFTDTARLWSWHEDPAAAGPASSEVDELRRHYAVDSAEATLLSAMLWTLVWSSDVPAAHLLEDYFAFTLAHPFPLEYDGQPIWLGHEFDLAEHFDRTYPEAAPVALSKVWHAHRPDAAAFRAGLGIFLPRDPQALAAFDAEFREAAEVARVRR